jgi:hypothetical protein
MEIAGSGKTKLKYRTFIVSKKNVGNKQVSKTLKFDETLLGAEMSEEKKNNEEMMMLEKIDYPNNKNHIYRINPEVFARYKYLTKCEPERMFPQNEEFMQAILSQLYTQLRQDPLIKSETLVRKVLYSYRGILGDTDEMIQEAPTGPVAPEMEGQGKPTPANVAGQTIKETVGRGRALLK